MNPVLSGAKVAVEQCMDVGPSDTVLILCDNDSSSVGEAIRKQAAELTSEVLVFNLDEISESGRPLTGMPKEIEDVLPRVTASFFVAGAPPGELQTFRIPLLSKIIHNARHAHMVGVTEEIMSTGLNVNYLKVAEVSNRLYGNLKGCREVHVTTPAGTDFTAYFDENTNWIPETGLLRKVGEWDNLPAGEVFTAPVGMDGTLVVDGCIGDWLGLKHNKRVDFTRTPLVVEVETREWGTLKRARCDDKELLDDFLEYTSQHENSSRVGELGIGTNIFIDRVIANMLQDEKFPSVHVAFGDPYHDRTGVGWQCPTHIDMVMLRSSIWIDGKQVMDRGRYLLENL